MIRGKFFPLRQVLPQKQAGVIMKKMLLLVVLTFVLSGCSASVRTPLLDMKGDIGSRMFGINSGVRVFYPHGPATGSSLAERYGPEWKNIQNRYPEYRFN